MGIDGHLAALRRDGDRLAAAAALAGFDAEVLSAPGWRVRDLVTHTGCVPRWAASYLQAGHAEPRPIDGDGELVMPDGELLGWFRDGHAALVGTFANADPAVACWTLWRGAPSPLAFWARRQAHETAVHRHETAVHRVDAELALAASGQPGAGTEGERPAVPAAFATDGIDELLTGFYALRHRGLVRRRRSRCRSGPPTPTPAGRSGSARRPAR
ncbi:maleylpyruvate isomerase N-terminal domain-containing protein [Pseudofrankia sp. DC12]|uniref:maleylpyruvate isomerase N-terminal domain-containing protein n=1 Tax=Pseudofrankia sp. DC12 TaxID=683315 RepID=UPI001E28824A|nr:maleylpyruvate isomerase N-terminal domain-containing protein [Pseudofrankia sp. DC12]